MGLIEVILLGIQFKGLQKPLVFFSMFIGLVLFSIFGLAIVGGVMSEFFTAKKVIDLQVMGGSLVLLFFSVIFFGLAWLCGHFMKKCFE